MSRALVIMLVAACSDRGVDATPPPVTPPVVAGDARAPVPDASDQFIGVLVVESVDIAPRVAGVLKAMRVNVGDAVTSGQVVVDMDPTELAEEVRAARAAAAAAAASVRAASVDSDAKRREANRAEQLFEQALIAQAVVDAARSERDRAEAALQQARSTLNIQTSRLQTARDHVADTSLRAPFAGTVAERHRDAGSRVDAGVPVLRIVGTVRLRFAVPVERSRELPVGRVVSARIETFSAPVSATIKYISPTLDQASRMVFIDAELVAPSDGLREGLAASVHAP